jgi:glutathione peroxidase
VSIFDFEVTTIDGRPTTIGEWRGHVMLIVNVASQCGYTPQYRGLEALYRTFQDQQFVVLGFPCDQFGSQEPGTSEEIQQFCSRTYGVTFPLFAKIDVNGPHAHPLFTLLKSQKGGLLGFDGIKWNFSKFLVGRNGEVLKRYGSRDTPEEIAPAIERALGYQV